MMVLVQTGPTSWACLAGQDGVMLHTRSAWETLRVTGSTASGRARLSSVALLVGVASEKHVLKHNACQCVYQVYNAHDPALVHPLLIVYFVSMCE